MPPHAVHDAPPVRRMVNGVVRTLDPRRRSQPRSIHLLGDRIAGFGDQPGDEVAPHGDDGLVLDLDGAVAIPGLIDCHLHAIMGGLSLGQLDLATVDSHRAFEVAVERHAATLGAGEWLQGRGWSERNWPGHRLPDRSWLAPCGSRPAVCWRSDIHACVVNDAVLHLIGARDRPDPPGGKIVRDASGAPTGLLLEAAAWELVRPHLPEPTLHRRRQALADAQAHLLPLGLTTVMSMEHARDLMEVLVPARTAMAPRMVVTLMDREWPLESMDAWRIAAAFSSDDRLAVLGFKAFIDGTLGSRTARMLEAYADDPGNRGVLVELAERRLLGAWARAVHEAGFSPSMHAIGDEAVAAALDAIAALPADGPRAPRIEHAQTVHPRDLHRLRGRSLSMQPLHRADDGRYAQDRLGADRMERFFPFRRLREAGALLGFGSDWPVVSPDPLLGMWSAITGRTLDGTPIAGLPDGDRQCLSPEEALVAYTRDAAVMLGVDAGRGGHGARGVLREGALADIVVLDADPLTFDWSALGPPRTPHVLATIVGGRLVWSRGLRRRADATSSGGSATYSPA